MQEVRSESSAAELGNRQLFTRGKQQESCSADPCDSVTDDTSENGTLIRSPHLVKRSIAIIANC